MFIYLLPFAILGLSSLLRLAIKLRLTLPLVYAIVMPTLFRGFYLTHTQLADSVFFLLIALAALSWLISLCRWLYSQFAEQKAALELIRQAKANGQYRVRL